MGIILQHSCGRAGGWQFYSTDQPHLWPLPCPWTQGTIQNPALGLNYHIVLTVLAGLRQSAEHSCKLPAALEATRTQVLDGLSQEQDRSWSLLSVGCSVAELLCLGSRLQSASSVDFPWSVAPRHPVCSCCSTAALWGSEEKREK